MRICKTRREKPSASMKEEIRDTFIVQMSRPENEGSITMEKLASIMGIAKGTLYLYYRTKNELVRDALETVSEAKERRFRNEIRLDSPAPEQLMAFARIMMEDFAKNRWLRKEFLKNVPFPPTAGKSEKKMEILSRILEKGIREGSFRNVPVKDTALLIRCTLIGHFRHLLRTGEKIDIPRFLALFQDFVLRALKS